MKLVVEGENPRNSATTTTKLVFVRNLPSLEMALKILDRTLSMEISVVMAKRILLLKECECTGSF